MATQAQQEKAVSAYLRNDRNAASAARDLGMSRSTFRDWLGEAKAAGLLTEKPNTEKFSAVEKDGYCDIFSVSPNLRTLEQVLEAAQIDLTLWRVVSHEVTNWDVTMKLTSRNDEGKILSEKPQTVTNWRHKVKLERIVLKHISDGLDRIMDGLKSYRPPKYRCLPTAASSVKGRPTHAVMGLADVHFGKLCWDKEVGHDFDLPIAENLYMRAVEKMLDYSRDFNLQQIIMPIGNDFFHFDNLEGATAKGTVLDTDGRLPKVFAAGVTAVRRAVERAAQFAPVKLLWVPGNHDRMTSYYMAFALKCIFEGTLLSDVVDVDTLPSRRKYLTLGNTMLGFDHGETVKHDRYPLLMATEAAQMWAACLYREMMIGHYHRRKEERFTVGDSHNGVLVRTLESLTGTDAWHYDNGFVQNRRATETLFYDDEFGYRGDMTTTVQELL